jgi:hypothetical protein
MAGTYLDMQSRIADEIATTSFTTQIKLEILSAIQHYERERFWFNEGQDTTSTVAGQSGYAVPTDLLEFDVIELTYSGHPYPMHRQTWDWFTRIGGRDVNIGRAPPNNWVYHDNQIYLFPIPDAVYTLTLSYLKQLTTLSADADTNAWMVDGEALIRSRARQSVLINYRKDAGARAERDIQAQSHSRYMSLEEHQAFKSLIRTAVGRISTGRITPTRF